MVEITDVLDHRALERQTRAYERTGGTSRVSKELGFRPAFKDAETSKVYLSKDRHGRCACVHLLDGLPDDVVLARGKDGRVSAVKGSLVAGFVKDGRFYDRDQAACEVAGTDDSG